MKKVKYIQVDDILYKIGDADEALSNVEIDLIFNEVFSSGYYSGGESGSFGGDMGSPVAASEEDIVPEGTESQGVGDYVE